MLRLWLMQRAVLLLLWWLAAVDLGLDSFVAGL